MERESLLTMLVVLLGGVALQTFAQWPSNRPRAAAARELEHLTWARLCWPLVPALLVAAWLCGWALSQPDPVPDRVGALIFVACVPFVLLIARAVIRALWSLLPRSEEHGAVTVGLLWPRIVLSPGLAEVLPEAAIRAALEHERAHVQHWDPLRIWLGQIVSDLQWPWPSARRRFQAWLAALECARDEEARAAGIDGADLAAAILGCLRHRPPLGTMSSVRLTGEAAALEDRVARLLKPLPQAPEESASRLTRIVLLLVPALLLATALGLAFGERVLEPLLAM